MPVNLYRRFHGVGYFLRDHHGAVDGGCRRQDDAEFVAAQASGGVGIAHHMGNSAGDFFKDSVSSLVAETVIDVLERIHIENEQRKFALFAPRQSDIAAELIVKQRAVRQAR